MVAMAISTTITAVMYVLTFWILLGVMAIAALAFAKHRVSRNYERRQAQSRRDARFQAALERTSSALWREGDTVTSVRDGREVTFISTMDEQVFLGEAEPDVFKYYTTADFRLSQMKKEG